MLDELGLASYAAGVLQGAPPEMQSARMVAAARHLAVRSELRQLLSVWQRASIEALVFKGFHLAEFVYPSPDLRRYSDVDLLIHPLDAGKAADIALEQDWQVLWRADQPTSAGTPRTESYSGHEVLQLRHPRSGVHLDVHRRLVHNNHNRLSRHSRQERITQQAWAKSQAVDWDGVRVHQLNPVDAVLIGLVLNRSWSPEDWELRPHDYLDFRYLVERFGLEFQQLEERSLELGCPRTFRIYLSRCDPFNGVCNLTAPSRIERQRWNVMVAPERGNRYLERSVVALGEYLITPFTVIRELPSVLGVVRLIRSGISPRAAAAALAMPGRAAGELPAGRWRRIRRGTHRSLRMLGLAGKGNRDLEAVALLAALRRRSYPAHLCWEMGAGGEERPRLELDGVSLSVTATLLAD